MQTRTAIDKDGNTQTFTKGADGKWAKSIRSATGADGVTRDFAKNDKTGQWEQVNQPGPIVLKGGEYDSGTTPKINEGKSDQQVQAEKNTPLGRAQAKGPEALKRLSDARGMSNWGKFYKGAVDETKKLVAGTADIIDTTSGVLSTIDESFLPESYVEAARDAGISKPPSYYMESSANRAVEQKGIDEQNAEFKDVAGVPGFLGSSMPYLAMEAATGPISSKLVSGLGGMMASGLAKGARAVGDETKTIADILIARGVPGVQKAKDVVQPKVKRLTDIYVGREKYGDPNNVGRIKDIIAGTGTGAVSGAMQYDNSMADGAVSGFAGGVTGAALAPWLSKKHNANTPAQRATIEAMKRKKYRVAPGIDINNKELKSLEQGLRNDNSTSAYMKNFDDSNQRIKNKIAYNAMGVSDKKAGNMTMEEMRAHIDGMGTDYDKLVAGTRGKITPDEYTDLDTHFNNVINKPLSDPKLATEMEGYKKAISDATRVGRDPTTGRFTAATFDGKDYQSIRRHIKNRMSQARLARDQNTVDALEPIVAAMDKGVERGVTTGQGSISPAAWKDMNEKFAMKELLVNSGMTTHGDIDTGKLYTELKSNDMQRMLTGKGGRIKDLHLLGKMEELEMDTMNNPLTGANLHDPQGHKMSVPEKVFTSKAGKFMPSTSDAALNMYLKGYPAQYGLAGMNRFDGLYKPSTFTRSMSQAGQLYPQAMQAGEDTYDSTKEFMNSPNKLDILSKRLKEELGL